ncbi:restriction endonuclease subunit S [Bacillus salitolerans]|uniref:Restriction endonuclease subunit S n=1 Tax=Bacillus salitolerans TaxID=1437434 RepID=A0ABW4LIX8_9BACI
MSKVLLGVVAKERKETCKGSKNGYPIVGLEHLTPEEVTLSAWYDDKENSFTKLFRKGDVLFGRRRAYLKKAAVAPFDGICSGDITVIEAIPEKILPELLPFIIQNDALFDFAIGKSAGSLSPRVKWEHLKNYEFELPDMDKQREMAKMLWAMDATKKSYQKLLLKTDELVKAQFIEMFGDVFSDSTIWERAPFDEVITDDTKNGCKIAKDDYLEEGQYPIIDQGQGYIAGYKNEPEGLYERVPAIIFGDHTRILKYVDVPFFLGADGVKLLKCSRKDVNYIYLHYHLMLTDIPNTGYNRHFKWLKMLVLSIPPLKLQEQFASFVLQSDKSKFELEQALAELTATYKKVISENLG